MDQTVLFYRLDVENVTSGLLLIRQLFGVVVFGIYVCRNVEEGHFRRREIVLRLLLDDLRSLTCELVELKSSLTILGDLHRFVDELGLQFLLFDGDRGHFHDRFLDVERWQLDRLNICLSLDQRMNLFLVDLVGALNVDFPGLIDDLLFFMRVKMGDAMAAWVGDEVSAVYIVALFEYFFIPSRVILLAIVFGVLLDFWIDLIALEPGCVTLHGDFAIVFSCTNYVGHLLFGRLSFLRLILDHNLWFI